MNKSLPDHVVFSKMKECLYTPVVGDILDSLGFSHQFLPPAIRPLSPDMKLAGIACTVLECDVFGEQPKPFGLLTEALDQLRENEIYIATGAHRSALWGELLTAAARMRGASGAVLDGWHRDTPQVLSLIHISSAVSFPPLPETAPTAIRLPHCPRQCGFPNAAAAGHPTSVQKSRGKFDKFLR